MGAQSLRSVEAEGNHRNFLDNECSRYLTHGIYMVFNTLNLQAVMFNNPIDSLLIQIRLWAG